MALPLKQIDVSKIPRGRVELHLHLDGSIRVSTVWDLMKKKDESIVKKSSFEKLQQTLKANRQESLQAFLNRFKIFSPMVSGDEEAIARVAYELCEDQALQGVAYFETRYSPHLLASNEGMAANNFADLSPEKVVKIVNDALKRGENDFNVKARSILCCINYRPEWSAEVVRLAELYKNDGVVGIDCAAGEPANGNGYDKQILEAFKKAKEAKIHRTCHAGEMPNSAANVAFAVNEMYAERIGHGYHVVEDPVLYNEVMHKTHFEVCPYSSYVTCAVTSDYNGGKHPIVQFAEDEVSFSINKDDPTIIQTTLDEEYKYLANLGLTEAHFIRANINAAKASFLPNDEKNDLINQLLKTYGITYGFADN